MTEKVITAGPGVFVTLEGTDGSGKSTQIKRLREWLEQAGIAHTTTHEPGGTALGERIRQCFLDVPMDAVDGKLEAMLVFAARRHHLRQVIQPAVAAGHLVLCDRFTDSTFAYQGFGRGVVLDELMSLDRWATGNARPDLTLLFDIGPEDAAARTQRAGAERSNNRLDREHGEFYRRVRDGYRHLVEEDPERFRVIDASGSVDETSEVAITVLSDWLIEREWSGIDDVSAESWASSPRADQSLVD